MKRLMHLEALRSGMFKRRTVAPECVLTSRCATKETDLRGTVAEPILPGTTECTW
jgi:hypothetical protein